jgi:hypothetical protein
MDSFVVGRWVRAGFVTLGLVAMAGPAMADKIANPIAVFTGLDKITGRIINFEVNIDETVQFGALQVTPRVCYTRPPSEPEQTDSFVQVDEVTLNRQIRRIFSGWMYASSPGLNAVEHPVYDVWLVDCKGRTPQPAASSAAPARPAPAPAPRPNTPGSPSSAPANIR